MATTTKKRKWLYVLGALAFFWLLGRIIRSNSTSHKVNDTEKVVNKMPVERLLSPTQKALKAKYLKLMKDCCLETTTYRSRRRGTTNETAFSLNKYELLMQKNGFTRKPNGHLTEYQKIVNKNTVVVEHLTQPAKDGWFHIDSVHVY